MKKLLSMLAALALVASIGTVVAAEEEFESLYPASGIEPAAGSVLINGERIGCEIGWGNNYATARDAAFDGDPATYFDPFTEKVDWAGIDAGEEMILTNIVIHPRDGWLTRFNGATIEASNDPEFADAVVLFVSVEEAAELTYIDVSAEIDQDANTGYRYFRYCNWSTAGDCGEVELYGYAKDGTNPIYGVASYNEYDEPIYGVIGSEEASATPVAETEAPVAETEAPVAETEAPVAETEAPVADVEETVDAANVAEETKTEETKAPQTFDAAIIAGVAAVVSLAGYAVSKKTK